MEPICKILHLSFLGGSVGKNSPANTEDSSILSQEYPLEEDMATHSSILAWKIPWTEEAGGLQHTESQGVGYHRGTDTHIPSMEGKGQTTTSRANF